MSDTPTNEELTIHYSAMQDSVDLINAIIAGEVDAGEPIEAMKANIAHLSYMKDRFDFGSRDMTSINAAIAIDPDTVTITPYVDQSNANAAMRARTVPPRDFMDRFTDDEKIGIMTLAHQEPRIQLWLSEALADEVWLDHPKVDAGLQAVIDSGANILTAERKAEIIGV
jgi:hypothetical protein